MPILVRMPKSGAAMSASSAISPGSEMPASRNASSAVRLPLSTASGSPTWLLKLPGEASALRPANSVASASLTTVLPLLPVIATTWPSAVRRYQRASRCKAASGSATLSRRHPGSASISAAAATIAAAAPLRNASPRKRCPSVCRPGRATNNASGPTRRESTQTWATRALPAGAGAPIAAAIASSRVGIIAAPAPRR